MGLHAPTWERVCARGDGHAARGVWGVCHRISRKSATNISSRELTRLDVVFRKAKQARLLKEGEEESALLIMTPDVQQAKQRTRQQEHGKLPPPNTTVIHSRFAPAEAIAFSLYSIGSLKRRMRKRNRICEAEYCCSAPLIVMKFLSDCERGTQARVRQGTIGHEGGAARAS